ncbi:YdeI/OmpD-associated family protein [Longimicrobium sp.]|uniref:YdeI/OmpD-associated family protein n=1 Tax=Longimicrobium sp. TaxID=2029185 RepID=UPI002E37207B|nr:YdeI/OmpD-associated family protein [Longimicrobium sp.]HEX6036454.1 YdeI/OmpD-associated family protein [Longimicrobium sp.]
MEPIFFASPDEFRAWLAENHEREKEVLVGFHKKHTGRPTMTWAQSVDEALCYGWIDGVRRSLGEEAYTIRFTPRKARSTWSAVNIKRVPELAQEGRMQPAGLRAYEAREESNSRIYSHERKDEAVFEPAMETRFRANEAAWSFFQAQAPSYRKAVTHWVITAKQEATRQRRMEQLIAESASGRRVDQFTSPAARKPKGE